METVKVFYCLNTPIPTLLLRFNIHSCIQCLLDSRNLFLSPDFLWEPVSCIQLFIHSPMIIDSLYGSVKATLIQAHSKIFGVCDHKAESRKG